MSHTKPATFLTPHNQTNDTKTSATKVFVTKGSLDSTVPKNYYKHGAVKVLGKDDRSGGGTSQTSEFRREGKGNLVGELCERLKLLPRPMEYVVTIDGVVGGGEVM